MTITALPTAPSRTQDADTFNTNADAWAAALPGFVTEANALAAALNSIAAGTAVAIPYTFSTTTTDADPGAGYLRLDNATQNLATTIRADLTGADGSTWTDVLATFDDSTSTIKGHIMLQKLADATKWILFSVSALASPSGYKNITVAVVAASAASPFANNDSIILKFTRNGDKGDTGAAAANPGRVLLSTVTAAGDAQADIETTLDSTYDEYELVVSGFVPSADGSYLLARMKLSGAYVTTNTYDWSHEYTSTGAAANAVEAQRGTAETSIRVLHDTGNAAGEAADFTIYIHNPAGTSFAKRISWRGDGIRSNGALQKHDGVGKNSGTGALTGIRLFVSSGNVTLTARLYGISKT